MPLAIAINSDFQQFIPDMFVFFWIQDVNNCIEDTIPLSLEVIFILVTNLSSDSSK